MNKKHRRYVDEIFEHKLDFVSRRYKHLILKIFLPLLALSIPGVWYLYHIGNALLIIIAMLLLHGVYGFCLRKYAILADSSEFQSAIFSNAMRHNSLFNIIVREDHSIFYADTGAVRLFGDNKNFIDILSQYSNDEILKRYQQCVKIKKDEKFKIALSDINCCVEISSFSVSDIGKKKYRSLQFYDIDISPLPRPGGYFIIRGKPLHKEYIYERFINVANIGVYVADKSGNLIDKNAYLNSMLNNMEAQNISYVIENFSSRAHDESFSGDVILRNATHKRAKLYHIPYDLGDSTHIYGFIVQDEYRHEIECIKQCISLCPIGIIVAEHDGSILNYNQACKSVFDVGLDTNVFLQIPSMSKSIEKLLKYEIDNSICERYTLDNDKTILIHVKKTRERLLFYIFDDSTFQRIETQLLQSQKMQSIGQLTNGIAHDFNNILTAILGFCDLLAIGTRPESEEFANVSQIKQNAIRASELVKQLLAFSRQQDFYTEIIDARDVVIDLSGLLKSLMGDGINIDIDNCSSSSCINIDRNQLEQIIVNISINARDAMSGNGNLSICVDTIFQDQMDRFKNMYHAEEYQYSHSQYVVISIGDTGVGIDANLLHKIFDPFFTTKPINQGTGLGLSTVYGIVQQFSGMIIIDHKQDIGSMFYILFPYVDANIHSISHQRNDDPQIDATEHTNNISILLVEDENAVRKFANKTLERCGYTVYVAADPRSGIEIFKQNAIDLIITDMVMHDMSGKEMLEVIRKIDPVIKAIFISGYSEESILMLEKQKNYWFLPKPFSLHQLTDKVQVVLNT